ncbi:ABC transporter permease [Microvirga massiliensis]|uniref:ABC transporter permease n=1 Tax=Microvirga massiliensis TaxID=1033741 RepID=UPI00062BC8D5|nr:ABC transporter permease subunit [Microvirga massiliensis]
MRTEVSARLVSLAVLLLIWQVASVLANSAALPPPANVFSFILSETASGELPMHLWATLRRVAIAFSLAMVFGVGLGVVLGRLPVVDRLADSWLLVLLNTPALIITVLCYVWLGLTEAAAIAAVTLNKAPNVAVIMREGARSIDPQLEEMRRAFRFDRRTWLLHVLFPQLEPYVVAAARSGLALVWKIVLVVELLGRPDGVGFAISYYFQLFDVRALLGYSLVFSTVVLLIDFALLQPLEWHARRWRIVPDPA